MAVPAASAPAVSTADAAPVSHISPMEFAATRRGFGLLLAVGVVVFGLLALATIEEKLEALALPWRLLAAAAVAIAVVWLARTLVRQALSRQPVLRLDADGISGAALQPALPWSALDDATLGYGGILRLYRKPEAQPAPRWWRGQAAAPLRVSLHLLHHDAQDQAHDAVHAQLALLRAQAGAGEAASRRAARIEDAFEDSLNALTPTPWALYAVVALNVLVWAMNVAAGLSPTRPLSPELLPWGANAASAVVLDGQWWRLLSATFLHAGIVHLAFNMLGLWEAGKQLCRLLGNPQFLLVYLASALCASAASLHYTAQHAVSVGASGAIFGVLGALLAASWHYRHIVPPANLRRLWIGLGFFIGYSLLHGLGQENVDNAAHIGGLLSGTALGLVLLAPVDRRAPARRRRTRATLAAAVAAIATVYTVLATPVPTRWQAQVYAAQALLPEVGHRFDAGLRQFAQDQQRVRRGELDHLTQLRQAEQQLLPTCADITRALAPLRVPRWEPTGRRVEAYLRVCAITTRAIGLELAVLQRAPDLPADAQAQLQHLSAEMAFWTRQLAGTLQRPPPTGGRLGTTTPR
jgi:rhomboid protease GluP